MRKIKLPTQRLEAHFEATQADRDERTIPVTFYTGAEVLQFSWEKGEYNLTLSLEPGHVRLGRFKSGRAPFTQGHASANDPLATLGVISNPRIDNGKAKADIRFSKRADVDPIFSDVLDGILSNVSVGASLYKLTETTQEKDERKSFLATDWEPTAVALVGIGADSGAHFSAVDEQTVECEIEFAAPLLNDSCQVLSVKLASETSASDSILRATSPQQEAEMPGEKKTGEEARNEQTNLSATAVADEQLNAARNVGVTGEQGRVVGILKIREVLKLPLSFAEKHIRDGTKLEDFRTAAIDEQAREAARVELRGAHVDVLRDEADTRRRNMTAALLERFEPKKWSFDEQERDFRYHEKGGQRAYDGGRNYAACTLLDIAKECLAAQTIRWQSKNRSELVQLAFQGTSDFPFILADVAGKSLRAGYEIVPSQWKLISARRTAADFKDQRELTLDSSSRLTAVPETGEFARGALVEGKETYAVKPYGKIIAITRQAIINDDLGAFTRTPQLLGQEVAYLEADTVFGIITANAAMRDTYSIFDETYHFNVCATPAAISVDNLGLARKLLMLQTGSGGKVLGIQPAFLLAPATKGQLAEQYTSLNYQAAQASNINPLAGRLTPIIEARLDATSTTGWYLFADPNTPNGTVLIYAYLEGQEGPYTATQEGFNVDGVEIKIRHDFAAAAVDYRGAVKNAGA